MDFTYGCAPCRDLPPDLGDWKNTHHCFCRCRDRGICEKFLNIFIDEPDYDWLIIDASHCKVHPHAAGGGNQVMGRTKGVLNTKIHLTVDAHGMPVRAIITSATVADCTQAFALIEGQSAKHLLSDKGYDSDTIIKQAIKQGMRTNIPPRKNRKKQRKYDKERYKLCHLVENAFLHLRCWRGIATRYAKHSASFASAVNIKCMELWAKSI